MKYPCWESIIDTSCYEEYYGFVSLNRLREIIWYKKLIKLIELKTNREKYKTTWNGYDFVIDIDYFWFWKLIEIDMYWKW